MFELFKFSKIKLLLFASVIFASLLIVAMYGYVKSYVAYNERVEYCEHIKKEIKDIKEFTVSIESKEIQLNSVNARSFDFGLDEKDTKKLKPVKDGQILFVSGTLRTNDSIRAQFNDEDYVTQDTVFHNVLWSYYIEEHNNRGSWNIQKEESNIVSEAFIDAAPLDTALIEDLTYDLSSTVFSYSDEGYSRCLKVIPDTSITCIAMMKNGKLTRLDDGQIFIYSADLNETPDTLLEKYMAEAKSETELPVTLAVIFGILLILSVVGNYIVNRNLPKESTDLLNSELRNEIKNVNNMRYVILAGCVVALLVTMCLFSILFNVDIFHLSSFIISFKSGSFSLLFIYVLTVIVVCVSAVETGNSFLCKYYKKKIVAWIMKNKKATITKVKESDLDLLDLHNIGVIQELEDDNGGMFSDSVYYRLFKEDQYELKISNSANTGKFKMNFLERSIIEIIRERRSITKNELLHALCIEIPMDCDKRLRLSVVPEENGDYSGNMKVNEKDIRWGNFPENYKLFMNEERDANEQLLDSTHFLENVNMIIETLKSGIKEESILFYVFKGTLYVFVINDINMFDVTINAPVSAYEVGRDSNTIDAMCEIGKKWK